MAWKKVSDELSEFLEDVLKPFECEKRKMFGCPVYFVNNNMFAGVHGDSIMLRFSVDDRKEMLETCDEAAPFEPMEGRIMKEYIELPESFFDDKASFDEWLDRSYRFVSSLLPKKKKKKKKVTLL